MPTYSYRCTKCGLVQDEFHGINAEPEIKCNECQSKSEKIFTGNTNFILKGSDWPSQEMRFKKSMSKKNEKMKSKMVDRKSAGEGVSKISDLTKN